MKVFTVLDYYLPGYRAGGPPRTISNLVAALDGKLEFYIFTRNHDVANRTPYNGIDSNRWNPVGAAQVFYCSPDQLSIRTLRRVILELRPEVVYLNSFFSPLALRCLVLRRLRLLPPSGFVVAPRGEFSRGALRLSRRKKQLYRVFAKAAQLYKRVLWQASSEAEKADILRAVGTDAELHLAPNITATCCAPGESNWAKQKTSGAARFVFISRVSPKKNLQHALTCFRHLKGDVVFDIYGPQESESYWRTCAELIEQLPANVRANYCGPKEPAEIPQVLANYDFFVLPTLGENYGHVIVEALSAGRPVVISDQTPWDQLERLNAGWTIALHDTQRWVDVLQHCVVMDAVEYGIHSRAALQMATSIASDESIIKQNVALFEIAAEAGGAK